MAKKKELYSKETIIKGSVLFQNVDPNAARFEMEDKKGTLRSNRRFQVDPSFLPDDFDPNAFEVSGEYSIKIVVKELPPKEKK